MVDVGIWEINMVVVGMGVLKLIVDDVDMDVPACSGCSFGN